MTDNDAAEARLRDQRDRAIEMLKRWLKREKGESVDVSLVHDTAKFVKATARAE